MKDAFEVELTPDGHWKFTMADGREEVHAGHSPILFDVARRHMRWLSEERREWNADMPHRKLWDSAPMEVKEP